MNTTTAAVPQGAAVRPMLDRFNGPTAAVGFFALLVGTCTGEVDAATRFIPLWLKAVGAIAPWGSLQWLFVHLF